jgi:hypothetical protein
MNSKKEEILQKLTQAIGNNENYIIFTRGQSIVKNNVEFKGLDIYNHINYNSELTEIISFHTALKAITEEISDSVKKMTGKIPEEFKFTTTKIKFSGNKGPIITSSTKLTVKDKELLNKMMKALEGMERSEATKVASNYENSSTVEQDMMLKDIKKASSIKEIASIMRGC